MNVGFDGTLHPSGSTAQSTYSPVDENIAHKVRQASPDVKGLLDSISSVAAMIGEFEEKSRERNYNVDSQKLRLDYAQAMSGEMNAMAMKQYADKDSFMRDYEQREANVRESVLSRARGDGESAGYFRNWARYGNLVSQDLELLSGKSRLGALTTYGNRQLNDYYKEIDSQYEQASVLGVNGFPIIDTMVDNDVRIPKANKEFAKSKMKSALIAKTARDNHEQTMRTNVFNDVFTTKVIQETAGMKPSEYPKLFDNYRQTFMNTYHLSVAENVKLMEAQRDAATENLSGEQKEVVVAAYNEQIKEFKKAAKLDEEKIRAQTESLRSKAEKEDVREFQLWKHEPGSVQLTRAGALNLKELTDEKTKSKEKTEKEKKVEELLPALKDYFGGNTNREWTNEKALEIANTIEAVGVDFGANLRLQETEEFVMASGIPMMIPDGVSYTSLSAEEQQKVLTHSIGSSLCEDLAKCDPAKNSSTMIEILKKAQEWLPQEEYDKLKNFAIAIIMNDSPTKPSKEAMAQYQADLDAHAMSIVGVKKKEELREYPEASRFLAEAKAIMAAIPNDGAAQAFLNNFKGEFAKIYKQEESEIGFRNAYYRLANRETYKDIRRVGVPKNEALPKPSEVDFDKQEEERRNRAESARIEQINSSGSERENKFIERVKKDGYTINHPYNVYDKSGTSLNNQWFKDLASTPEGEAEIRLAYRHSIKNPSLFSSIDSDVKSRVSTTGKALIAVDKAEEWIFDNLAYPFKWFHKNAVKPVGDAIDSGLSAAYDEVSSRVKDNWEGIKQHNTFRDLADKEQTVKEFGWRKDGTRKGPGWFSPIELPDGSVMTELSITIRKNHTRVDIPLVNPLLTKKELDYLKRTASTPVSKQSEEDKKMFYVIEEKALKWAEQRWAQNKSPFIMKGEEFLPLPKDEEDGEKK